MLPDHIAAAVRHHWWLFLLRGVAGVAFGVLTLLWPGATLVVLMAFIAAYALVDGLVALVYAFRLRPLFDRWWMLLIQGVISAAFGVLAIFNPGLSVAYIVVSVALWMLVAGLVQLLLARVQKTMGGSGRWSMVGGDRKSTRLNSSHSQISYAVFCLKKKKSIQRMSNDPQSGPDSQDAIVLAVQKPHSRDRRLHRSPPRSR